MSVPGLILYDLDGTIWDSVSVIVESFVYAYEKTFGRCERTEEDFKRFIGRPLEDTFSMHDPQTAAVLKANYLDYNEKLLRADRIDLFPGVREDLGYIKSLGIPQGVVTSKRREAGTVTLVKKNLDTFFDIYVFKEDTLKHKPDGEPLIYAAEKLGISDMSKVVYVGDAMPDALCARSAGAGFYLVSWSQMKKDQIMAAAPANSAEIKALREIISGT